MVRKKNGSKGFTLTELIVVAFIIILLTSLVLWNAREGTAALEIDLASQKLGQDIRRVMELSLRSKPYNGCLPGPNVFAGYGVFVSESIPASYDIFADCNNNE